MGDKMNATNARMDATNASIHKQTLLVALNDMLSDQNSQYLAPVPTGMLPGGQTFAEEASAEEIVKLAYVYLQEINEIQPDDSQRQTDGHFPAALITRMDHQKMAKLSALEVIAGLAPQATIDTLIENEVNSGGRYEDTAYSVLMCRALFLRDIMLNESLFRLPLRNIGTIDEAVKQTGYLERLAELPFASKISLKLIGMVDPNDQLDVHYQAQEGEAKKEALSYWKKISRAFDHDLDASYRSDSHSGHLAALRALVAERISHLGG